MSISTVTNQDFDVIVVGGGHAGIEAAHAAATMGSSTLLITLSIDTIGLMPCNPAIGGIGKGHIVYEISALGGLMPRLCTKTYLQARMLNTKKGPAVQGLRLQIDKHAYSREAQRALRACPNLTVCEGVVEQFITADSGMRVTGVQLADGRSFTSRAVVVTTGTFLNGAVHIGTTHHAAGRQDEISASVLSEALGALGLRRGRLKTGTPPRLLRSSIDFSKMERQEAGQLSYLFDFEPHQVINSHDCYITRTNEKTHDIIRRNIHLSAMYSGNISGTGARYCPSIEDKIGRFADKTSHHVFVEPESATSEEIYPNGISTSLPEDVQEAYVRTIPGLEKAEIVRPGYAIEYDFVHPDQLHETLQVRGVEGLYLAGQVNGTTGYEEAAGQGLVAGINAHLKVHGKDPFVVERSQGYIGVMINDLVTMGVDEPYRMFTSRAERRLLLRQDNVFARLMPKGHELGLVDQQQYEEVLREQEKVEKITTTLRAQMSQKELDALFSRADCSPREIIAQQASIELNDRAALTVAAEIRYAPYLERERREVERAQQLKKLRLPADITYTGMPGLSRELQSKLERHRPETIAQAALIPGMTPAAVSLLIFKVRTMVS